MSAPIGMAGLALPLQPLPHLSSCSCSQSHQAMQPTPPMQPPHPTPSRRHPLAAHLGVALLVLAASHSRGEDWQVLLPAPDFAPLGWGTSLILDPYSTTPLPGLLLCGQRSDNLLASVARVTPLDAVPLEFAVQSLDSLNTRPREVLHRSGDGLYVVGADASGRWAVRRSADEDKGQPLTWDDEETFGFSWTTGTGRKQTVQHGSSRASGATLDQDGGLWVAGYAFDSERNHWIVRHKSPSGTGTWSPKLDIPGSLAASRRASRPVTSTSGICYFPGNAKNPTPALLAFGILDSRWTVVRSEDGFATWQVQPWTPAGGTEAEVWGATVDPQGHIYLCGVHGYEGATYGWLVRSSDDGGRTWKDLLNKREADGGSFAARIMVDTLGTVWVGGATPVSPSPRTAWAVVRNEPGQPWQDSLDGSDSWSQRVHPLGADTWSRGRAMLDDGQGSVYLTGDVLNPTETTLQVQVGLLRWARPTP